MINYDIQDQISMQNEQHQRCIRTMEIEAKNTAKITEEFMSLREDIAQKQIALEAARRNNDILTAELKQLKAEANMNKDR